MKWSEDEEEERGMTLL